MLAFYRSMIDWSANSLRDLPTLTRFQIVMLFGLISTPTLVTGAGAWMWFGPLFVVHLLASRLAVDGVTMAQVRRAAIRRGDPVRVADSHCDGVWGA